MSLTAFLSCVDYVLPEKKLTNEELCAGSQKWTPEKIHKKTGILERRIAAENETGLDLGEKSVEKLFAKNGIDKSTVDCLLFCTQTPDYKFPPNASILHSRLGLAKSCAAFDINLGCSGFPYCLWMAKSLILGGEASCILIVLADTLTKCCDPNDMVVTTIFGDAGSCALVTDGKKYGKKARILNSVVGTDGRGYSHLGFYSGFKTSQCAENDKFMKMNGPEVFNFTLQNVDGAIRESIAKNHLDISQIEFFFVHQANKFILDNIREKLQVDVARFPSNIERIGNTSCASVPILLGDWIDAGLIGKNSYSVACGFGVGFSWASTLLHFE